MQNEELRIENPKTQNSKLAIEKTLVYEKRISHR